MSFQVFSYLSNGTINMTFGAIVLSSARLDENSFTTPHIVMSVFLASPAGIPYTSLQRIAMPFSNIAWLCVLLAVIMKFGFLSWRSKLNAVMGSRDRSSIPPFLIAIQSALGDSLDNKTIQFINNRCSLIIWISTTLVLRTIYSAELFDLLQAQINERAVNSIDRLIESKYHVYCQPMTCEYIHANIPQLRHQ